MGTRYLIHIPGVRLSSVTVVHVMYVTLLSSAVDSWCAQPCGLVFGPDEAVREQTNVTQMFYKAL